MIEGKITYMVLVRSNNLERPSSCMFRQAFQANDLQMRIELVLLSFFCPKYDICLKSFF